ncbi:penicillin-binding transpeptidase domain-containing protein [Enterococcus caccae]|uniref:Penicillin-binding protein 4 n=1 Tax=Enterococcus caccae ATCC BAA-1240 TaxID=1158612 RepID=R3W6L7_9ENTE|nr:penicillin-binding transpeptidase domain-containing protein [Enterococcus caccae]EOL43336.1 penicillin-binding protein 4 [Enterococcus caccae ATCC BAA-1240]EOT68264.1 penicillin-binding protein 4 [Enterococcus caccae ATCC BAA-1240]OJG26751.1 penicillin-binding protein 4 [Enterococcus caccae]
MERSKKKKSNKPVIIAVSSAVAVVALAGGYFAYSSWEKRQELNEAEKSAKAFLSHLAKQEFDKFPELLNESVVKESGYDNAKVVEKYQTIFSGIQAEGIKSKDVKVVHDKENQYTFTYKLAMNTPLGSLENLSYKTTIKKAGDRYKINWAPNLIFPEMSGQDKVTMGIDPAKRGEIVDRKGEGLAVNQPFDQVGIVPGKLGEGQDKTNNIKAFSEQFRVSVEDIEQKLKQEWVKPDSFVPLAISFDPVTTLPQGAASQDAIVRYYPLKEAAAQLVGYVGNITAEDIEKNPTLSSAGVIGKVGLEQAYDKQLRGQDGGNITIVDEQGNFRSVLQKIDKKDGEKIQLTIDKNVQSQAYDIFNNRPGSAVVMDPQQGDLLAAASSPSFNPNKMANGISQADYDAYANNENLPFTARFATGYAPGSTFKTITGGIGLDAGTLKPDEEIEISGLKWQKDASWGDYFVTRVKEASPVNLRTALVNSDNIYFAQQTLRMGEDTFRKGLDKFIFGEKLDLAIPMNPAQISNEDKFNSEILLADTGYGQGQLLVAPIQQATMYTVFQNEGKLVYPKIELNKETKTKENVISSNAANTIVTDLLGSVEDETGYVHNMYNPDFSLAAKTGTAEIKEKQDTLGKENSFLLAMDRSHNKFSAMIMVEDSRKNDTATNISKNLIDYLEANIK